MAMTEVSEEIWASLEDLAPFNVAGYVVAEPADEPEYGAPFKLHGLFDTVEAAHGWANANTIEVAGVWVVWAP